MTGPDGKLGDNFGNNDDDGPPVDRRFKDDVSNARDDDDDGRAYGGRGRAAAGDVAVAAMATFERGARGDNGDLLTAFARDWRRSSNGVVDEPDEWRRRCCCDGCWAMGSKRVVEDAVAVAAIALDSANCASNSSTRCRYGATAFAIIESTKSANRCKSAGVIGAGVGVQ